MRLLLILLMLLNSDKVYTKVLCKETNTLICLNSSICEHDTLNYYTIKGHQIEGCYIYKQLFSVNCMDHEVSTEDLPAAPRYGYVNLTVIEECMAPLNASYQDILQAKNVEYTESLKLTIPSVPKLESRHFRNLSPYLYELKILAKDKSSPPRPAGDFLRHASKIRSLTLENVRPDFSESEPFPDEIEKLHLVNTRMEKWTNGNAWLERLQSLKTLFMQFEYSKDIPFALPKLRLLFKLKELSLHDVFLDNASLPGSLNGSSVQVLKLTSCGLRYLPSEMFAGANLTELNLQNNELIVPKGVLSGLKWLTELNVENTLLSAQALLRMVSPLSGLMMLNAKNNPLGSLCSDVDKTAVIYKSRLPEYLQILHLHNTRATQICPEWVNNDALMHIDLSYNNIRDINFNELMMIRRKHKKNITLLELDNNPELRIVNVTSTSPEYCRNSTLFTGISKNRTRVQVIVIANNLKCDCSTKYWLRRVTKQCSLLKLEGIDGCTVDRDSAAVEVFDDPDKVMCPHRGTCLPNCTCWNRPRDNAMVIGCTSTLPPENQWPTQILNSSLALHVAPHTLTAIPHVKLIELHAANNNISSLGVQDIGESLLILDVSNNSIRNISVAAAQKLEAIGTNVSLAGNMLTCTCSDVSAFNILKRVVHRWKSIQCLDQTFVSERTEWDLCPHSPLLLIILSVISSILLVLITLLFMKRYEKQIRQVLFKLNWCRRYIFNVKDDTNKTADAFLSYAYADYEMLNKLKMGLESRGYSIIDHERDWLPGEPIPEHISKSVKSARRTILLVSDNFAISKWALEEFHVAHAHAMERRTARVLVIRYNLTSENSLPSDLRTYLKYNTYLDWDDEDFWRKLCRYMPPKRLKRVVVNTAIEC